MYKTYALAILAGDRDINNLKGIMRDKVQAELDKLTAPPVEAEETPKASPDHIPATPDSVQANVPKK